MVRGQLQEDLPLINNDIYNINDECIAHKRTALYISLTVKSKGCKFYVRRDRSKDLPLQPDFQEPRNGVLELDRQPDEWLWSIHK